MTSSATDHNNNVSSVVITVKKCVNVLNNYTNLLLLFPVLFFVTFVILYAKAHQPVFSVFVKLSIRKKGKEIKISFVSYVKQLVVLL